jgi:hypothetical protein
VTVFGRSLSTRSNAAVALPWLRALSARWATTVVDLPGQPGLSDPHRPRRNRLAWYGRVLDEALAASEMDGVVLLGNSLGAAVALAADSPRIAARVLISPAGLHPTIGGPETCAGFGRLAVASDIRTHAAHAPVVRRPDEDPPKTEVEWMTLMSTCCRTTPSPPPLSAGPSRRAALCSRGRRTRPVPATLATGTGHAPNHEPRPSGPLRHGAPDHPSAHRRDRVPGSRDRRSARQLSPSHHLRGSEQDQHYAEQPSKVDVLGPLTPLTLIKGCARGRSTTFSWPHKPASARRLALPHGVAKARQPPIRAVERRLRIEITPVLIADPRCPD